MRRFIVFLSFPLFLSFLYLPAPANAASTLSVGMSAQVQDQLELSMTIYAGNIVGGTIVGEMNFGRLVSDTPGGPMRGENYFSVVLYPNSSSRKFKLTQTATALSNGSQTLPAGACIVSPWPKDGNGNDYPSGSSVGTTGSFVASQKLLYQSDGAGTYAPVAMTYAIPNTAVNGATEFVPSSQAGGNYSSNVTFQIELVA